MLKVLICINLFNHTQDYNESVCLTRTRHKQTVVQPKKVFNSNNTRGNIILIKVRISFLRDLDNNQIKELPPGVFNNNTELISL